MKKQALVLLMLSVSGVQAWESHYDSVDTDSNGDVRFNSEHVRLTEQAITSSNTYDFLINPAAQPRDVCRTVQDFNSSELGWSSLRERTYCPATFSELPDFFHNMEDYINQGNKCPPYASWDVEECHTFEHFMGALNSSHFPPQIKHNYQRYHDIAQAVTEHSNDLHSKLFLADALDQYRDYWEECKLEATTYESIGQHYLQDQWSMGHMWRRWGGPDVNDFEFSGPVERLNDVPRARIALGTAIGAISGMIHGWKSTVDELADTFAKRVVSRLTGIDRDAMCYHEPGVEWTRLDYSATFNGMGDLFIDQAGDFSQQEYELAECSEEGFRAIRSFRTNLSQISTLCWENFATNRAMNIGLNLSPSSYITGAIKMADDTLVSIAGLGLGLSRLAIIYKLAAEKDPYDTYLAEGYTSASRNRRINLMGIGPNDEYKEVSSYIDPARTAPGDPADLTGVVPDHELFGVRQVKFFNKCHTNLYCEDTDIVNQHRNGCQNAENDQQQVDCQICEELGARFYLGSPPICSVLAPGVDPDPELENKPSSAPEISDWCREQGGEDSVPEVMGSCPQVFDPALSEGNSQIYSIDKVDENNDGEYESRTICQYWGSIGAYGSLYVETPRENGETHGVVKKYHQSGGLSAETTYVYGVTHGPSTHYYESGAVRSEAQFIDGKYSGTYFSYWEDPHIVKLEVPYNNAGEKDGVSRQYDEAGNLEFYTSYSNGVLDGERRVYNSDGSLKSCKLYEDGAIVSDCMPL